MGWWSQLPGDLVRIIEDFLVLYIDKVRFRSVCAWWNSSNLRKLPSHREQLPWLLHTHDDNKDASHGFFNVIESKTYQLDVPEAQGNMFKGSSHGWVVTVEDTNAAGPAIYLLNPLTRDRIKLPPRNKFPDVKNYRPEKVHNEYGLVRLNGRGIYYIDSPHVNRHFLAKIVLSSTPSEKDCVVVAIYGVQRQLAYCNLKDKKWTSLCESGAFADVIFHKGKLHALTTGGSLLVFESISANAEATKIASLTSYVSCQLYLVESSDGGLIMVKRHSRIHRREGYRDSLYWPWKTYCFTLYKHDPSNLRWVELKDLGDDMLFLGHNSSLSISCRDFPGYKGNCIYFTDDFNDFHRKGVRGGHDLGIFNFENGRVEPLQGFECNPYHVWPPPVWATPSTY